MWSNFALSAVRTATKRSAIAVEPRSSPNSILVNCEVLWLCTSKKLNEVNPSRWWREVKSLGGLKSSDVWYQPWFLTKTLLWLIWLSRIIISWLTLHPILTHFDLVIMPKYLMYPTNSWLIIVRRLCFYSRGIGRMPDKKWKQPFCAFKSLFVGWSLLVCLATRVLVLKYSLQ